jgi:hypothetical protein
MGDGLLKLNLPPECKFCGAVGHVTVEATIAGDLVILRWCCRKCSQEWAVTSAELTAAERRRLADRRRRARPRTDRRR